MEQAIRKENDRVSLGEFWTSKQRQAHPIHYSVSYRASFKPELPSFFFSEFLTKKGSTILDPFGGRGTTAIQANLEGHYAIHNDINPLSIFLARSRQNIPNIEKMNHILDRLDLSKSSREDSLDRDLLAFYHRDTLKELKNLKEISQNDNSPEMQFIKLIALSRLHGHSDGFFSVYSFPQVSIPSQQQYKNNLKKGIQPEYRPIIPRIKNKIRRDLSKPLPPFFHEFSGKNQYFLSDVRKLNGVKSNSVDLIVTSPPFLDKVNYQLDNWIRHWFLDIPTETTDGISMFSDIKEWTEFMHSTLSSAKRVLKKGAFVVVEVGEVKKGKNIIPLDDHVLEAGISAGLEWSRTYINTQKFTKLSNCWKVSNNEKGTNSNRCVVLQNI